MSAAPPSPPPPDEEEIALSLSLSLSKKSQHEVDGLYAEADNRTIELQNLSRP